MDILLAPSRGLTRRAINPELELGSGTGSCQVGREYVPVGAGPSYEKGYGGMDIIGVPLRGLTRRAINPELELGSGTDSCQVGGVYVVAVAVAVEAQLICMPALLKAPHISIMVR